MAKKIKKSAILAPPLERIHHDSAHTHVTGKSEFIDDRTPLAGELNVGLIFSPHAHAKIKSLDIEQALKVPGVAGVWTYKDLAHNRWGTIFQDQPVLAEDTVQFAGEVVAVVAAESIKALALAKKLIKVDYELLEPILSIDVAKKTGSYIGLPRTIERGDIKKALKSAPFKLKGQVRIKGQDHFYLESHACIAYPKESGQIEVHSSAQHPAEVQHVVAHSLGLGFHDVVCVVKRMGGAFGGKESQSAPFAVYAALVAQATKRSARLILSKDDDMVLTGKRNPFQNDYTVGFDKHGKILGLDVELYSDGGAYADLSTAIMERAMLHSDNAYFIPNVRIFGQVCKTHHHPHTAFRGFGGPKGVATIENIIEDIAQFLKKDSLEIRKLNCYQDKPGKNITPYGQKIPNNCLPKLFSNLEKRCDYSRRQKQIKEFNLNSQEYTRGLALTAVKFGISFTTRHLNQGAAIVNIHLDGTIQISTGATEMGQGVNTRIAQVAADSFGIPLNTVRVMTTSTEKIPNTSPTAASSGTDINASATLIACDKIKSRLAPLAQILLRLPKDKRPSATAIPGTRPEIEIKPKSSLRNIIFKDGKVFNARTPSKFILFSDLVREAYLSRISLSDNGFFKYSGIFYDKTRGKGDAFFYFTQGVAASEVEVNRLTGEVKVRRVDILMDLGRPINYDLDVGQVTGGFIQGMGWVTTENLYYEKGYLVSHSPSTYKIPNIQDTPRVFNVDLLDNSGNMKNIKGTKAVAEPPLLLGVSVWLAIKRAIAAAQENPQLFSLKIPATNMEILSHLYPEQDINPKEYEPPKPEIFSKSK